MPRRRSPIDRRRLRGVLSNKNGCSAMLVFPANDGRQCRRLGDRIAGVFHVGETACEGLSGRDARRVECRGCGTAPWQVGERRVEGHVALLHEDREIFTRAVFAMRASNARGISRALESVVVDQGFAH